MLGWGLESMQVGRDGTPSTKDLITPGRGVFAGRDWTKMASSNAQKRILERELQRIETKMVHRSAGCVFGRCDVKQDKFLQ